MPYQEQWAELEELVANLCGLLVDWEAHSAFYGDDCEEIVTALSFAARALVPYIKEKRADARPKTSHRWPEYTTAEADLDDSQHLNRPSGYHDSEEF